MISGSNNNTPDLDNFFLKIAELRAAKTAAIKILRRYTAISAKKYYKDKEAHKKDKEKGNHNKKNKPGRH